MTRPLPNTGDFKYTSDIGQDSVPNITKLVESASRTATGKASSVVLTSGYRPTSTTWHGLRNAGDYVGSAEAMRVTALYLRQYSPYLLELIHTNPNIPGGGVYVKNGKVVGADYYGPKVVDDHRDHIHVATTNSALRAASDFTRRTGELPDPNPTRTAPPTTTVSTGTYGEITDASSDDTNRRKIGCLPPTIACIALITSVGTIITKLL